MPSLVSRARRRAGPPALVAPALVVAAFALSLASPALAQAVRADATFAVAPSAGPGWRPRVSQLGRIPLTDAERAEIVAVADGIEAALRRVPMLAPPEGFAVEPILIWSDSFSDRDHLLTWMYRLRLWRPDTATVEPVGRVVITVNPYPKALLDVPTRGVFGEFYEGGPFHTYMFAPHITGAQPGGGLVYDGLDGDTWFLHGVLVAGDEPYYVPVSREQALRAWLTQYGEEAAASAASSGFGRQLAEASPAELAQQACFDLEVGYFADGGTRLAFVPLGPGAECLVVGNPDFYAARGDRLAPRIIDVWLETDDSDYMHAELKNRVTRAVLQSLDWAALGAIVRAP